MREGKLTSEFLFAKGAGAWSNIALILGVIIAVCSQLLPMFEPNSPVGIVVGGVIALAGIAMKTLTSLGYLKSRTSVKEATAWEDRENGKDGGSIGYDPEKS